MWPNRDWGLRTENVRPIPATGRQSQASVEVACFDILAELHGYAERPNLKPSWLLDDDAMFVCPLPHSSADMHTPS